MSSFEAEVKATLQRIEQRQAAYEKVAHRILGMHEVHNEKLDAILAALVAEPPPSPVATVLTDILASMRQQASLLSGLPDALDAMMDRRIADALGETMMEPARPGAFDTPDDAAH